MIEYVRFAHEKLVAKNKKKSKKDIFSNKVKKLSIRQKALFILSIILSVLIILFLFFAFYIDKIYFNLVIALAIILGLSTYSINRESDEKFENDLYKNAKHYQKNRLEELREILKKFEFYSEKKLEILIQQCDSVTDVKDDIMRILKVSGQIFLIPLILVIYQVWLDKQNSGTILPVSTYTILLSICIVLIVFLLAPTWSFGKSKKIKQFKRLKRELQDILLSDFY